MCTGVSEETYGQGYKHCLEGQRPGNQGRPLQETVVSACKLIPQSRADGKLTSHGNVQSLSHQDELGAEVRKEGKERKEAKI